MLMAGPCWLARAGVRHRSNMRFGWAVLGLAAIVSLGGSVARAQASALPSAQAAPATAGDNRGRKLLDEMVTALGGDAWLHRKYWKIEGKVGSFYKGQPTEGVYAFEEYYRANPFGQRDVIITHFGPLAVLGLPGSDHRDDAVVWTPTEGWEVTYKGKKALTEKETDEFRRRQTHTIDVVVNEWLKQPGVEVTYEGSDMVERHLVDKVSVMTASNDVVTLHLDANTHLPLSRTYQYRDPQFKDIDTDTEQYDSYQPVQGILTPFAVTRLHNGDIVSQRFITKVTYMDTLPDEMFNPDLPLQKKVKK